MCGCAPGAGVLDVPEGSASCLFQGRKFPVSGQTLDSVFQTESIRFRHRPACRHQGRRQARPCKAGRIPPVVGGEALWQIVRDARVDFSVGTAEEVYKPGAVHE